jgi:hypothetical protein|uniref:Uncharacterized protein n=1 Tax=Myoviridae sp. ctkfK18 TaxID=2825165 RepID=A0A8S5VGS5_9CAUD|nr:MAG TPA: hypothetical protein [Myoviridae sp. ctkfK18]
MNHRSDIIYFERHKFLVNAISKYTDYLRSLNLTKKDFYKELYNYITRWKDIKISTSINAIDPAIREAAKEDINYLNLISNDLSKLAA